MARSTGKAVRRRPARNPPLIVLGNPGGGRAAPLSREVHEVRYRHADDGRDYKHEFGPGVAARLNTDGSVTLRHARGKPLWDEFPDRPYLVNPKETKAARMARKKSARKSSSRRAKRPPPKGFRSWKAYMASIRKGSPVARKRSKATRRRRNPGRAAARRNPPRRSVRRRHYRRNPGIGRGLVGTLMQGVMDAALVVVGKGAARAIPTVLKLPQAGALGMAVQAGAGIAAGMLAEKVKRGSGRLILAGALAAPIESFVKGAGIPFISGALGDYPMIEYQMGNALYPGAVGTLGGYPNAAMAAGVGEYPQAEYIQQM